MLSRSRWRAAWVSSIMVAVASAIAVPKSRAGVVFGPLINPSNAHSYLLLSADTWTASEAAAVGLGGHLVTINDSAENDWVFANFASVNDQHYLWTGLNDSGQTGTFTWVSGEPLTYTKWGENEPDNLGVVRFVELSAPQFDGAGFWNNYVDSSNEFGVAIDGVVEIVPEPQAAHILLACIVLFIALQGRRVAWRRCAMPHACVGMS